MKSNSFFWVVLFLGFLLLWGCAKEVAPPEVDVAPEPVAEIPPPVVDDPPPADIDEGPESAPTVDIVDEGPPIEEDPVDDVVFDDTPVIDDTPIEVVDDTPVMDDTPMAVVEDDPVVDDNPVVDDTPIEVVEDAPPEEPVFVAPPEEPMPTASLPDVFEEEKALQDIHFEYDRDQLNSQNKEILRSNADWLKSNPSARVEIQGHADERGTNNYNLGLGERRAMQTKKYLISLGVDESRLYTISYGEEKPFCFESNENCWWENRRAHFTVAE